MHNEILNIYSCIKKIKKVVKVLQDYLASGPIIRDAAKKLLEMIESKILPKELYNKMLNIYKDFEN